MNKVCIKHIFKSFHGFQNFKLKKKLACSVTRKRILFGLSIVSIYHDVP